MLREGSSGSPNAKTCFKSHMDEAYNELNLSWQSLLDKIVAYMSALNVFHANKNRRFKCTGSKQLRCNTQETSLFLSCTTKTSHLYLIQTAFKCDTGGVFNSWHFSMFLSLLKMIIASKCQWHGVDSIVWISSYI